MKDIHGLIKDTRSVKEAAERCWDLFSVKDRLSSYIPYAISKFEDGIRILSNRLEELESKWRDKSLKREIFASSSSSIGAGMGILATASVGLHHKSARDAQIALFVIGSVLTIVVSLFGAYCYFY